jgi:hypothetical protein
LNDELILTDIPPNSKLPLEIEVTAWQLGHERDPAIQSAEPVTRKFNITQ